MSQRTRDIAVLVGAPAAVALGLAIAGGNETALAFTIWLGFHALAATCLWLWHRNRRTGTLHVRGQELSWARNPWQYPFYVALLLILMHVVGVLALACDVALVLWLL